MNVLRKNIIDDELEKTFFRQGYKYVIGVDEVGRGSWAGPVVVGAFVYEGHHEYIPHVKDSKMLTRKRREGLYPDLTQHLFSIGLVESQDIDEINILEATKCAIDIAVKNLDISDAFFLIDGSFPKPFSFDHICITNGDEKHYSIAAASIVAKVFRDRMMEEYNILFPQYGFANNVGYGTSQHHAALKKHGVCALHRRSYKPIKRLIERNGS